MKTTRAFFDGHVPLDSSEFRVAIDSAASFHDGYIEIVESSDFSIAIDILGIYFPRVQKEKVKKIRGGRLSLVNSKEMLSISEFQKIAEDEELIFQVEVNSFKRSIKFMFVFGRVLEIQIDMKRSTFCWLRN